MTEQQLFNIQLLVEKQKQTVSYSLEWWDLYFQIQLAIWSCRYGTNVAQEMLTKHRLDLIENTLCVIDSEY